MDLEGKKALTFLDGEWLEGNPLILGALSHATWMASVVFDGARYFEGGDQGGAVGDRGGGVDSQRPCAERASYTRDGPQIVQFRRATVTDAGAEDDAPRPRLEA